MCTVLILPKVLVKHSWFNRTLYNIYISRTSQTNVN